MQQRFLTAYAELRSVAPAARHVGIHRATVYRWAADPVFAERMRAAWQVGYQRWRREVWAPQEAVRQAQRELRRLELRPARQERARRMGAARQGRTQ